MAHDVTRVGINHEGKGGERRIGVTCRARSGCIDRSNHLCLTVETRSSRLRPPITDARFFRARSKESQKGEACFLETERSEIRGEGVNMDRVLIPLLACLLQLKSERGHFCSCKNFFMVRLINFSLSLIDRCRVLGVEA